MAGKEAGRDQIMDRLEAHAKEAVIFISRQCKFLEKFLMA